MTLTMKTRMFAYIKNLWLILLNLPFNYFLKNELIKNNKIIRKKENHRITTMVN